MDVNEHYSEEVHGKHQYFELGNFPLIDGVTLRDAKLAYKTHGKLNANKSNAILFPHMYSGSPMHMEMFVGEGRALDPARQPARAPLILLRRGRGPDRVHHRREIPGPARQLVAGGA